MKKLLPLMLAALLASGCMSTQIKTEAFGKAKRYGVISIIGATDISDANAGSNNYSTSLVGLVSAVASKDINFSEDSSKMFNKTREILDQEFAKAKSFRYVSSKKIINSKAYRTAKGEEPKFGIFTIGLAPNYKYFNDKSAADIQKIMKDNRLDGAIIINSSFSYGTGGVGIGGVISIGSTSAYSTLAVSAMDKDMNPVWTQSIRTESDDSIANIGGAPNFKKLYPLLEQATRKAIQKAVQELDGTVYAKK